MTTFNVYRRESNDTNPPVAIATGLTSKNYSDISTERYKKYLFSIGAVKGGFEKVSGEILVTTGDPHFNNVELLILPSRGIVDLSRHSRSLGFVGSPVVSNNSISFNGYSKIYTWVSTLGTSDFTLEMSVSVPYRVDWSRVASFGVLDLSGSLGIAQPNFDTIYADVLLGGAWRSIGTGGESPFGTTIDFCLMRKDGVFYVFKNKILVGTLVGFESHSIPFELLNIGADASNYYGGITRASVCNIHRFRHTYGVARYSIHGYVEEDPFDDF